MKELAPQHLRDADLADMEGQLREIIYKILFIPVAQAGAFASPYPLHSEIRNAPPDELREALLAGRVQYAAGIFSGQFNVLVSRALRSLGATFNKRDKTYRLEPAKVPGWVSAAGAQYLTLSKAGHAAIGKKLDEIQRTLDDALAKNRVRAGATVSRVQAGFRASAKSLEVVPELTADSLGRLAEAYSDNMTLWIKNWTVETIQQLRDDVQENALEGYRFDKLIDKIKQRSGASDSKAKFLARQETSLFMAQYRQERFAEAGVLRYRWSTSRDRRVRDSHRDLDGTIQLYSQPPIVDAKTGRRGNPGQDFNCRCVDIPIVSPAGITSALPPSREKAHA